MVDSFIMIEKYYAFFDTKTFIQAFGLGIHEDHENHFGYTVRTHGYMLQCQTGAHARPMHQGPWEASYAPGTISL